MQRRILAAIGSGLLLLAAAPVATAEVNEATLDTLAITLEANRKAMVMVNLKLDPAEAERFWPVYERYEAERSEVQQRQLAIVEEYVASFGSLSDEQAGKLVKGYLASERDRAELRQRYLAPFSEALPARKVLRFYQIENKIEAVLRYDLARTIPVIED